MWGLRRAEQDFSSLRCVEHHPLNYGGAVGGLPWASPAKSSEHHAATDVGLELRWDAHRHVLTLVVLNDRHERAAAGERRRCYSCEQTRAIRSTDGRGC